MSNPERKKLVLEYASLALKVKGETATDENKKRMTEIESALDLSTREILAEAERATLDST